MSEFQHLMVDIETMGNQSFSSIISIGALEFNIETGETGREFYKTISLQSCIDIGLIMNPDTVMWWMKQSDAARLELVNGENIPITQALVSFANFCSMKYQIWGNSARFDLGLMQNAYNKINLSIPWDFRKERCVRTLASFRPDIMKSFIYNDKGVAHNALADCYKQAGYCSKIWNTLKN